MKFYCVSNFMIFIDEKREVKKKLNHCIYNINKSMGL